MTESQLKEHFSHTDEPVPMDADSILASARGRLRRRQVLQVGVGGGAVAALAGITAVTWNQLSPDQASPVGGPTSGSSLTGQHPLPEPTFTMPPPQEWPVSGDPKPGVIYRVSGNLGFQYSPEGWSFWDLTKQATLNTSTWTTESPASAAFNNCRTGITHSDGQNYWGTVVPNPVGSVTMKLAENQQDIVVSGYGLPQALPFVLLYWHARPGDVEAGGDFVMTLEPGPGNPPLTIRVKA